VARIEQELALAKQELTQARAARTAAWCFWTAGILAGLALLGIVGAWLLPVLRWKCALASGGLAAAAAASYWLGGRVWVIPWVGLAVVAGLAIYAVMSIRRGHTGTRLAATFADDIEGILASGGDAASKAVALTAAKRRAVAEQTKGGCWDLIEKIRSL
jgi:hypothetical protein